jgi:hypothetical protein
VAEAADEPPGGVVTSAPAASPPPVFEAPAAPPSVTLTEPPSAPRAAAPASADLDTFRAIIGQVRAKRPELAACLHHAEVVHASGERLVLAFEAGTIFERNVSSPEAIILLRAAASEIFGVEPNVAIETRSVNGLKSTISAAESLERTERKKEALARAKQHPKIALASRILGAKLKEIRLPEE